MILPCFEYADFVVDSGPDGCAKSLQTIQNHCLWCCKGIRDPRLITRTALHADCSINRLHERRRLNILGLMYKHSRYVDNLIAPTRVLRSNAKMLMKLQRPKGQLYSDSPLYRGSFYWNKLDHEVQILVTHKLFMNKIKNG